MTSDNHPQYIFSVFNIRMPNEVPIEVYEKVELAAEEFMQPCRSITDA